MPRFSSPHWLALACAAIAATSSTHAAPTIWRCGSSYSDHPCEGGSLVNGSTPEPTADQRRHADEGARRDQAAADRMQRERLKLDSQPRHATIIGAPASDAGRTRQAESKATQKTQRPKKPDGFVASYADPTAQPTGKKKKKKKADD